MKNYFVFFTKYKKIFCKNYLCICTFWFKLCFLRIRTGKVSQITKIKYPSNILRFYFYFVLWFYLYIYLHILWFYLYAIPKNFLEFLSRIPSISLVTNEENYSSWVSLYVFFLLIKLLYFWLYESVYHEFRCPLSQIMPSRSSLWIRIPVSKCRCWSATISCWNCKYLSYCC